MSNLLSRFARTLWHPRPSAPIYVPSTILMKDQLSVPPSNLLPGSGMVLPGEFGDPSDEHDPDAMCALGTALLRINIQRGDEWHMLPVSELKEWLFNERRRAHQNAPAIWLLKLALPGAEETDDAVIREAVAALVTTGLQELEARGDISLAYSAKFDEDVVRGTEELVKRVKALDEIWLTNEAIYEE